ncbi:hypothetical protein DCS_07767 [Drechmeria coniospora]|uniref:Uncharacterized protein n=1 Tax=Drechmeria coniospora TaxID=98403 RepID=A0A151GFC5_DRECN|nr:hypothetical protein DCS_07767 [Drechmeria coniospora]KYK55803.1 hypothetical protein DCS_07767 [Drechmeria coniospora]
MVPPGRTAGRQHTRGVGYSPAERTWDPDVSGREPTNGGPVALPRRHVVASAMDDGKGPPGRAVAHAASPRACRLPRGKDKSDDLMAVHVGGASALGPATHGAGCNCKYVVGCPSTPLPVRYRGLAADGLSPGARGPHPHGARDGVLPATAGCREARGSVHSARWRGGKAARWPSDDKATRATRTTRAKAPWHHDHRRPPPRRGATRASHRHNIVAARFVPGRWHGGPNASGARQSAPTPAVGRRRWFRRPILEPLSWVRCHVMT